LKILVIQTAFLGDVVLSTSLLNALINHNQPTTVDILVRKGNESLLNGFPGLRRIIVWNKKQGKYRTLVQLLRRIREEKYDAVITLQRFGATGFLTALSGATFRIGYQKNPFSMLFTHRVEHKIGGPDFLHEIQRNDTLLKPLVVKGGYQPALFPSLEDYQKVWPWKTQEYFCIAPTSVWFTKQVPASKWLELIKNILNRNSSSTIYLLGGPDDRDACNIIARNSDSSNVKVLAGELSLLQTAALMKDAAMNYVNDSAPLHLASSMNAPVRAFFCSTVPSFGFGPLSQNSKIREVSGLACRPCGIHGHKSCPEKHFRCALDLTMDPE
jgi:heptosyltransferase-2